MFVSFQGFLNERSTIGPTFFNLFLNDLLYFINTASLLNFLDDNILSVFPKTTSELINILEWKSLNIADWFVVNKMIVNLDQLQDLIIDK